MDNEKGLQVKITSHPFVWGFGLLCLGFSVGISTVMLIKEFGGMDIVSQTTLDKMRNDYNEIEKELKVVNEKYSRTNDQINIKNTKIKMFENKLKNFEIIKNNSSRFKKELLTLKKELAKIQNIHKEQQEYVVNLEKENAYLISPGLIAPIVLYRIKNLAPQRLVEYFDGALTVIVEKVNAKGACLKTNFNEGCFYKNIGEILSINIGPKVYGIRVDRLDNYVGSTYPGYEKDVANQVNLSLLLIKSS